MKKLILLITALIFMMQQGITQKAKNENPFFKAYTTPFQAPPFDLIKKEHYIPAFEKGIEEQIKEIEAIVNNPAAPNFENTILAYQNSGKLLTKVGNVFYPLNSANTDNEMQEIAKKISPKTTAHRDNIMMNEKLFARIKSVYDNRNNMKLDNLQLRVVEKYYQDFVRNGANLSKEDKERLKNINQRLSILQLQFGENLLAETNKNYKLVIKDKEDLKGLPESSISAAAETAKNMGIENAWVFTLQKPSLIPFLQYAENRKLREQIYRAYFMRCNNDNEFDNKKIIQEIVNLRLQKATLLGYKNFAEYIISNNMAKTPDEVYSFLHRIMEPALKVAYYDIQAMQTIIDKENGGFKLASWDWWYYAEKLRKEKYDLDENDLKPYFQLEKVRDGMFYVAKELYGITFHPLHNVPVYHKEVEVFEVKESNGNHIGLLYLDYHPRDGKRNGAWCGTFRDQEYINEKKVSPLVYIVCNFTRPTGDIPALLTWDEVNTLFHEFGHALHNLFIDGKYTRIAGNVPRDMVELPSQVMEHWTSEPQVLSVYARHYKTGDLLPEELRERLINTQTFNQAFTTVEYVAASLLDMDLHTIEKPIEININDFEAASMKKAQLIEEIIPRYRTTYFSHITGGYAAGYYVYLWAGVLDSDAFEAYVESGDIFNKAIAEKFRTHILRDGGNDDGMVQYRKFRGKDPSIEPLLKKRGLLF